jgi:hypothetical protein
MYIVGLETERKTKQIERRQKAERKKRKKGGKESKNN